MIYQEKVTNETTRITSQLNWSPEGEPRGWDALHKFRVSICDGKIEFAEATGYRGKHAKYNPKIRETNSKEVCKKILMKMAADDIGVLRQIYNLLNEDEPARYVIKEIQKEMLEKLTF